MSQAVTDDETVLRHIPHSERLDERRFKPRFARGEADLSVSRFPPTSPAALVARVSQDPATSRVAVARVGDVRALGLDVVPDPIEPSGADPGDPGHALIVDATARLADKPVRVRLARVFRLLPPEG
jgi:hypothetical protein